MDINRGQVWATGSAYEAYVGRWSRLVAREFLNWLSISPNSIWLDVGCGTGALSRTILANAAPLYVVGADSSAAYIEHLREEKSDERLCFDVCDARDLRFADERFDAVVSGLVLNFIPDPYQGMQEIKRVTKQGGLVAVYVWDYAGDMQLIRYFWDAAVELDPVAHELDEGVRFPICNPERLKDLFDKAGLANVQTRAIDVPTVFRDFDDYWAPFLGGQGPAPSYAMSLNEEQRGELRERLRNKLPVDANGSISLIARAWAIKGIRR